MNAQRKDQLEPTPDLWDAFWLSVPGTISQNYHAEMVAHLKDVVDIAGRRVLDVGGAGSVSRDLARAGAMVCLVDFSTVATRNASALARQTPFEIVQADARTLPFADESQDIVFHQGLLEHFVSPLALLQEQFRVLKRGGILHVDVPQRFNWYAIEKRLAMRRGIWPYGWETDFTYGRLKRVIIAAGFTPIAAYGRGYHPKALYALRNLNNVERRLGMRILPSRWWHAYDAFWLRLERGRIGWHSLLNLGIIARK